MTEPTTRDGEDERARREIPYMLDNTPEELDRVRRIAAERHRQEAERITAGDELDPRIGETCPACGAAPEDLCVHMTRLLAAIDDPDWEANR